MRVKELKKLLETLDDDLECMVSHVELEPMPMDEIITVCYVQEGAIIAEENTDNPPNAVVFWGK